MRYSKLRTAAAGLAALVLVAAASTAADARTRAYGIVRGQPISLPDVDLQATASAVRTQPAMSQTRAIEAHATWTGAGVKVAVLDGGFDLTHEMLQGRIAPGAWDAVDLDPDPQDLGNDVDDDNDGTADTIVGHGTFVSSLILAVAPDAQILPIRVLDDEGWGNEYVLAQAVHHAVAQGCRIINMSLVIPDASRILRTALKDAANQGVVVVGSAGNEADIWCDDPNLANRVLAVGAVDATDIVCPWSVNNNLTDAFAPGDHVLGALGGDIPNSYAYWSGTSFAAPFASGGAALIRSRWPGMSPWMVCQRLRERGDFVPNAMQGAKRVDLAESIATY